MGLDKTPDLAVIEERARQRWEETGIHRFDPDAPGEIFSVDTPPPYVSASHLHVGHAMSYAQAEFIIRYMRMRGRNVFYPMGFDDNGLPTERYVEQKYEINKARTTRSEFRALCLTETAAIAVSYERFWRKLGLSVDWRLRYSTIDDHCRRTAQKSFLDLFQKGRVYRSEEPVFWDPSMQTALAQADLETITRNSTLHDIAFRAPDGRDLVISTTRPELIPSCVALYFNPEDERYASLAGRHAIVPITGHEVPILSDEDVRTDFGTGLMMVCTFGDGADVQRWKRDGLDLRLGIDPAGKLTDVAGEYAGLDVDTARKRIVDRSRGGRRTPRFAEGRAASVRVGTHAATGRVPDATALVRARPRPHRRASRTQRRARVAPRLHEGAPRPLDRGPQVRLEHHAATLLRRSVPGLVLRRLRRTRARDRRAAPRRSARESGTRRRVREVWGHHVHR